MSPDSRLMPGASAFVRRIASRAIQPIVVRLENQEHALARLEAQVRSLSDSIAAQQQTTGDAGDVVAAGLQMLRSDVESLLEWGSPGSIARVREGTLRDVDEMVAEALNRASEPGGFADQAGLWWDPAVRLLWAPGRVWVSEVTARILINPYVLNGVAALPVPSKVLDLVNRDLSLDLSIASFGHDVTLAGQDRLPLAHPRLQAAGLGSIDPAEAGFDCVVAISLDRSEPPSAIVEKVASDEVRRLVRPGGRLVLAVLADSASSEGEVPDESAFVKALSGWELEDCTFAIERDRTFWELEGRDASPSDGRRVGLVLANRAG